MKYNVSNVEEYLDAIPLQQKQDIENIRSAIKTHLPQGFQETYLYNMITYVIPLSTYEKGYHVGKNIPLPFLSIAAQKNNISVYHSGVYADKSLYTWFINEYNKRFNKSPNMGKSCIRFKRIDQAEINLLSELFTKMTPQDYIDLYESVQIQKR
jgi:hypothetical protein